MREGAWARLVAAGLVVMGLGACGGGDGVGPQSALPAALVGSWQAGRGCEDEGCAVTAEVDGSSIGVVLTDSVSVTMDLAAGGVVVSTLSWQGQTPRTVQGLGRIAGGRLVIDYPGTPSDTIVYAVQGGLLGFDFENAVQIGDVTGDGVADRLRFAVVFARR